MATRCTTKCPSAVEKNTHLKIKKKQLIGEYSQAGHPASMLALKVHTASGSGAVRPVQSKRSQGDTWSTGLVGCQSTGSDFKCQTHRRSAQLSLGWFAMCSLMSERTTEKDALPTRADGLIGESSSVEHRPRRSGPSSTRGSLSRDQSEADVPRR